MLSIQYSPTTLILTPQQIRTLIEEERKLNNEGRKSVVVLGGGLAGMTAALKLSERGFAVELFEIKNRLGGKVGSDVSENNDLEEHSYKVFPMFYKNLWKIFDEIGVTDSFYGCHQYSTIEHEEMKLTTLTNPVALKGAFGNLFSGFVPFWHMVLFYYMNTNLLSQSFKRADFFDRVSINGLHRSWRLKSTSAANAFEEIVLKALATPNYLVSAMTVKNVLTYWFKDPYPMVKLSKDNLHLTVVEPFEKNLIERGCAIFKEHEVQEIYTEDDKITKLVFKNLNNNETVERVEPDYVISALPSPNLLKCLNATTLAESLILSNLNYLNYKTMPVIHVYFNKKLENIPNHPVSLKKSAHQLSFVDISQTWIASKPMLSTENTILNVVIADITNILRLDDEIIKKILIDELSNYIKFESEDIEKVYFNKHLSEPVFGNETGIWRFRPKEITEYSNLFLAGAYLQTQIDMVSMEGAIATGLKAARAIDIIENKSSNIEVEILKAHNKTLVSLLKYFSMLAAAFAWIWLWITSKLD